jgi:hypothetical protein
MKLKPDNETGSSLIIDETTLDRVEAVMETDPTQYDTSELIIDENADDLPVLPKEAKLNDDGSVTLTLLYPRTLKFRSTTGKLREEQHNELVFRRLSGADMNAISATSTASSPIVAFAQSTRMKPAIMKGLYSIMDASDIQNGAAIIEYFFGNGRKTGKSS